MLWSEVRDSHPGQWLVIEALESHTEKDYRILDQVAVVETCPDGASAMQAYRRLHRQYPTRDFYFIHTSRETLQVRERHWVGVRRGNETHAAR